MVCCNNIQVTNDELKKKNIINHPLNIITINEEEGVDNDNGKVDIEIIEEAPFIYQNNTIIETSDEHNESSGFIPKADSFFGSLPDYNEILDKHSHSTPNIIELYSPRKSIPQDHYKKLGPLGMGAYGKVYKVQNIHTSQIRSLKVIPKAHAQKDNFVEIVKELKILQTLDHPNIIQVFESYEDEKHFFIVSEICKGGDMSSKLRKTTYLTEFETKYIMKQLISSIHYMHERKIVHGDIKLENIMIDFESYCSKINQYKYDIKLIDFGCSKFLFSNKITKLNEIMGTSHYLAPEVLSGNFNEKCDIWSCGIIMYTLLAGDFPFLKATPESDERELFKAIIGGKLNFDQKYIDKISQNAKNFLSKLLIVDPKKRISAKEALKDTWFGEIENDSETETEKNIIKKHTSAVIKKLISHKKELNFEHIIKKFITHNFSDKDDLKNLIDAFKLIDKDGTGTISKENLLEYSKLDQELLLDKNTIDNLLENLDFKHLGEIQYEEFIEAAIDNTKLLTDDNLLETFRLIDEKDLGVITAKKFVEYFATGTIVSDEQRAEFEKEINLREDSEEIDYEKFKSSLKNYIK